MFENTQDGYFSIDYVLSHDDGNSWGERGRVYTAANGNDAGAPQVVNVGGTIVVDFMTNEDGGGAPRSIDGGDMKTVTSTDGGRTYSGPTTIGSVGSHWPGMLDLDGNRFLAFWTQDGQGLVSQIWNK